jgi:predicted GIY-YIG superfamily endonuclease
VSVAPAAGGRHPVGTAYLVHFDRAIGNEANPRAMARHYIGWADNLDARLAEHRAGRGARLLAACGREGIGWAVVRTWAGVTRSTERSLKNRKQAWSLCPMCRAERGVSEPVGEGAGGVCVAPRMAVG